MEPLIRKADTTELDNLNAFIRQSKGYWGYSDAILDPFMKECGITMGFLKEQHMEVLEQSKALLGLWGMNEKTGIEPILDYLFIAPSFMGKGYGQRLYRRAVEYARTAGHASFWFHADPNSEPFYRRMGAVKFDEYRSYESRLVPLMRQRLS